MEKRHKPKEAIYRSEKILGLLYDKVESVDFVPQYEESFDKRILRAYKLDDALLKIIRQIKTKYDNAMKRLMAQQEIKTEFEVWSTFVLSKPRVGSDYKVQEEMARKSDELKDRFRLVCIEAVKDYNKRDCKDGKDFIFLGPFVAGMYKVTKEEMDIALAECRSTKIVGGREVPKRKMEPRFMPFISFPWLFEKELSRIATGIDASDDMDSLGLQSLALKGECTSSKRRGGGGGLGDANLDDYIQQEDGVLVHRGEELDLFRPDVDSEDLSGESDFEDARSAIDGHDMMIGRSGEVVLATEFQPDDVPEHLLSGTGVEDVVPRTVLDGFVDPRQSALLAHESSYNASSPQPAPTTTAHSTPTSCLSVENNNWLSASFADVSLSEEQSGLGQDGEEEETFEEEIIEEEMVDNPAGETSLEKLSRMMGL